MRILIVEDDPQIGDALGSGLRLCGFGTDWVRSLGAAARALRETDPAAVVLDLKLPDGCGLDLLADLRARASAVPVLILSARSQVTDRICGLDLGADDYVVKPFDIDEIAARLRALIRRAEARSQPRLSHRDIVLDPGTRRVLRDGA
ncbi:MAG: response regulator, partial [Gammaproteobacteria bacterium]|nr:response regulator [Gammaproteobacteria bacterium]